MANGIKNQWLIGLIIVGIVVVIFVVFNYQGKTKDNSLSEIFPEDSTKVPETEYEFVTDSTPKASTSAPSVVPVKPLTPAARPTVPTAAATKMGAPAPAISSAPAVSAVSGTYSIQILSSKDKAAAEKALEKVKAKGHAAYIVTKDLGDKGIWYRINIGSYTTKQEAENNLSSIKSDYKDGFIVYTK